MNKLREEEFTDALYEKAVALVQLQRDYGRNDVIIKTIIEIDGRPTSIEIKTKDVSKKDAEKLDAALDDYSEEYQKKNPEKTSGLLNTDDMGKSKGIIPKKGTTAKEAFDIIKGCREDFDSTADAIIEMIMRVFRKEKPPSDVMWYLETLANIRHKDVYPTTEIAEQLFLEIHTAMCVKTQEMFGGVLASNMDMKKMNEFVKKHQKGL